MRYLRWRAVIACVVLAAGCTSAPPAADQPAMPSPSLAPASVAASAAPAPTITASELQGRLLFGRMGGAFGDATIFTANADGSGDERIGGFLADKTTCCPRWSPDGSRIAFVALTDDERFTTGLIDPDGSNLQRFELEGTWQGACSHWMPDGQRMVCIGGFDDASGGIYTVRASDGRDPQPVITGVTVFSTDLSPDGERIVFVGDPVGPPTGVDPDAPVGSLYVVNIDGTGLERITPDGVYGLFSTRWSPDGEWILFAGLGRTGDPLYAVRPDGSELRVVYEDEQRGAVHPAWSPDGEFIVFALDPPNTVATLSVSPPNEVCVIRSDGTDVTCIIDTPDHKIWMDWTSP
jgi:Tol biopolymer transport system component